MICFFFYLICDYHTNNAFTHSFFSRWFKHFSLQIVEKWTLKLYIVSYCGFRSYTRLFIITDVCLNFPRETIGWPLTSWLWRRPLWRRDVHRKRQRKRRKERKRRPSSRCVCVCSQVIRHCDVCLCESSKASAGMSCIFSVFSSCLYLCVLSLRLVFTG